VLQPDESVLFSTSAGAIVAVNDEDNIEFANREALDLLRWDQTLIGQSLTTIIPERMHAQHLKGFHRYVKTGESNLQGATVRVPARLRDGTENDVDLTIRVFRRPDGTKLVAAALSEAALGHAPENLVVLEGTLLKRMYELI
jgi:PAS domain S-box-containing protein